MKNKTQLITMQEIVDYQGRNQNVIKRWVKERGYPATILEGRWHSDKELIDEWNKKQVSSAVLSCS